MVVFLEVQSQSLSLKVDPKIKLRHNGGLVTKKVEDDILAE